MGKLKFISAIEELFGLTPENEESKKKAVKELIQKLKLKRIGLKKELKNESDIVKRESLKDSLHILKKQIKKGKDILDD
jgi:hypothetical protein